MTRPDSNEIVCLRCHEGRHDLCQMGACTCCGLDAAGADTGPIQLTNRRRVAISGLMAAMTTETVHQHRAVLLLHGLLMEEARYLDKDDQFGALVWDPDGWELDLEIDGRSFVIEIRETG